MEEQNDLKEVIDIPSTNDQVEKVEETQVEEPKEDSTSEETVAEPEAKPEVDEGESVEELKERLKKLEEEKENYKKSLVSKKKAWNKSLTPEKEETEEVIEEDYPDWDETSKKFQKQTETKSKAIAERAAKNVIEKNNEKAAIEEFISNHPEAESRWNDIVENVAVKSKDSVSAIVKALDRAYINVRLDSGEIKISDEESKEKKGKAKVADMSTVSKTTSKSVSKGATLSPESLKMAERMRVNPEKLAAEDDSLTAEVNF